MSILDSKSGIRILIVEDSPTQSDRLRYILEQHGYEVTAAANGRAALEAIAKSRPTLVLSDIVMPEMDGYELCREIKANPALRGVPVILVTTLSDPHDVIRGLECQADNFIIKPYDEHYLLSRVQFILLNNRISERDQIDIGVEIYFNGQRHLITANRLQILNLLLSTYEAAVQRNQELKRAEDALRAANSSLEAANRELETFSYSVSHDLRAPLRAVEGFTRAIVNDHGGELGDTARHLMQRVLQAADRMSQLIDDLLNLSRVAKGDLQLQRVNLSELVCSIVEDLRAADPDRRVEVDVMPNLTATADPRLLRAALENLLSNAWKFTSKREDPRIEFGREAGAEAAYFVRDNGAGFDPAYADRLFGAFQRLHSTDEFPGTGIGLATVQRIIGRHGGRIWADGAIGAGATFRFTL